MTRPPTLLLVGLCLLLPAPLMTGADSRTWTDASGRTLDGSLVRQDSAKVWVLRPDGREVVIDKARLSPADVDYLKGQPAGPAAAASRAPATPGSARPGQSAFKSMKIDRSAWKSSTEDFHAGGVAFTQRLQTPHFLILAPEKIKPDLLAIYGEVTERTFAECVRDLPGMASVLTEKRLAIWLLDSDISQRAFGNWLSSQSPLSPSWERASILGVYLNKETAEPLGVTQNGRAFRTDRYSTTAHRSLDWPNRIHFLADSILHEYIKHVADSAPEPDGSRRSVRLLETGYAYFKEWQIAGKIETELLVRGASVEGFQNGRRWADAVRKVLKNPAGRPSLDDMLRTPLTSAQPIDVACAFGMMQFFNADPARFRAFDSLLLASRESKMTPTTEEFAKALGYDSPEGFDNAWIAFMSSDAFK